VYLLITLVTREQAIGDQLSTKEPTEKIANSMNSSYDIKDFQYQLMQSVIETALQSEMKAHL